MGEKRGAAKLCQIKRCDNSARTVITAGPDLDVDEIGLPKEIAHNLHLDVRVTSFNKNMIEDLARQGRIIKISPSADVSYSPAIRGEWNIEVGMDVTRTLIDGDRVMILRNPILQLGSMLGTRVKIIDGLSIELPLAVTPPLAADYDGSTTMVAKN